MQTEVWAVVFVGFGAAPLAICVGSNHQLLAWKVTDEADDSSDTNDFGAKGKARSALQEFLRETAPQREDYKKFYEVRRLSLKVTT